MDRGKVFVTQRRNARNSAAAVEDVRRRAVALDLGAPLLSRVNPRPPRLLLRVDAADRAVELVLPRGVSAESGLRFLRAQRVWIATRLAALPRPVPFVEGAIVPVLGTPHRIRRESDPQAPPVTRLDGEIRVRGDPAHLARRVRDYLIGVACATRQADEVAARRPGVFHSAGGSSWRRKPSSIMSWRTRSRISRR